MNNQKKIQDKINLEKQKQKKQVQLAREDKETRYEKNWFRVRAWLEKSEREREISIPINDPLPIEIVEAKVAEIEQRVKAQRQNKPKPFSIFDQPDDDYDFSAKPPSSHNMEEEKMPHRHAKPIPIQKPSVLDAFEDQAKMFELDDYIHAEDSTPAVIQKSQALKISKAISRFQPPALGPQSVPPKKETIDQGKIASNHKTQNKYLDSWQLIQKHEAKILFMGKMATERATERTAADFAAELFPNMRRPVPTWPYGQNPPRVKYSNPAARTSTLPLKDKKIIVPPLPVSKGSARKPVKEPSMLGGWKIDMYNIPKLP